MSKLPPEKLLGLQGYLILTNSGDTADVAKAFVDVLGIDDALDLMWDLSRHLPVTFPIAIELRDIEQRIDDEGDDAPAIDRTKMDEIIHTFHNIGADTGEMHVYIQDDILDNLPRQEGK
jgi:hypothetical protein